MMGHLRMSLPHPKNLTGIEENFAVISPWHPHQVIHFNVVVFFLLLALFCGVSRSKELFLLQKLSVLYFRDENHSQAFNHS